MLICEGELYTEKHSVGLFKVYLALEDAENRKDIVKVVDLVQHAPVYLTSETVIPFEDDLEKELLFLAEKYNYKS